MGKKIIIVAFAAVCIMSCSTDTSDTQTITIDENIPAIADLVTFVPDTEFDNTSKGKYVGIFGHHLNQELHGKIYINAGNDTRYAALIQLVNGEELKFTGVEQSRSSDIIYFEGATGSFDIDFTDYRNPEATNVIMNGVDTEAYISLAKSTRGAPTLVILGNYEETGNAGAFYGNWDLIGDFDTFDVVSVPTGLSFPLPTSVDVQIEEIFSMVISHTTSMTPLTSNNALDFGENTAAACAEEQLPGFTLPTTEAIIGNIPLLDNVTLVSAGGQTSMINGIEATWSLNYTPAIPIAGVTETYVADNCTPITSGVWSWNGRTGTTTVMN